MNMKVYSEKEWNEFTKEEQNDMILNWDRVTQGKIHDFPICPTLVDSTTGTRYDIDSDLLGDILKLNL